MIYLFQKIKKVLKKNIIEIVKLYIQKIYQFLLYQKIQKLIFIKSKN